MEVKEAKVSLARVEVTPGQVATALIASVLGWALDLFDLFIILYVAPTIAPLFFPSSLPTLSLASVYAAFGVTLLMRPAGSAIFGAYADKYGRKRAMVISVIGVGVATALMGAVPTIDQIGLVAPLLFLLLRLIQGIFVGGVVASTHTIGTETAPPAWRGLFSGLIGAGGAGFGGLLASAIFFVISSLFPGETFKHFGWRVMFFSGILSSIFGLFIFRSLEESPLWKNLKIDTQAGQRAPLRTLLSRQYLRVVGANLMLVVGASTQYYLTSGYLPTFLALINHLPKPQVGSLLVLSSLLIILTGPLAGHLSELAGRKKLFLTVGIINLILIPILYFKLSRLDAKVVLDTSHIRWLVLALTVCGNASYAPILVFLNERFPTRIRATGTAVSWNVGFAVGGMMPTFATVTSPGISALPRHVVSFLVGAIVIYIVGALVVPETRGRLE